MHVHFFSQYDPDCSQPLVHKFLLEDTLKSTLSGLGQFLVTESPFKMMKSTFYFTLKAFCVLKISKFLSWIFVCVEKRLY